MQVKRCHGGLSIVLMSWKDDLSNLATPAGHVIAPPMYFKLRPSIHPRVQQVSSGTQRGSADIKVPIPPTGLAAGYISLTPEESDASSTLYMMGNSCSKSEKGKVQAESDRMQAGSCNRDGLQIGGKSMGSHITEGVDSSARTRCSDDAREHSTASAGEHPTGQRRLHKSAESRAKKEKGIPL